MSKWRDVKQNRVEKNIPKKVLHSSLNFVSIAKRFKAFLTDTFLITTPILYIVIYLIMGSGQEFADNRSLGWGIIFAVHFIITIIRYSATLFSIISIFFIFTPFVNKEKKTFQDIVSNTKIIEQ